MLIDEEPPCWGMEGVPLVPKEWDRYLGGFTLPIRPEKTRGLPAGYCLYCQTGWFSRSQWPITPITAATEFVSSFIDHPNAYWVNTPIISGRFKHSSSVGRIPFLLETFSTLEQCGIRPHELAELLTTATVLELRQTIGSIAAAIDLTMTARAWVRIDERGSLVVHQATLPTTLDEAFLAAQVRYTRQRGIAGRYSLSESGWPQVVAARHGLAQTGKLTLAQGGELLGVSRERIRQMTERVDLDTLHLRRWPTTEWLDSTFRQLDEGRTVVPLGDNGSATVAALTDQGLDAVRVAQLLEHYGYAGATELRELLENPDGPPVAGLAPRDVRQISWELSEYTGFSRRSDIMIELQSRAPDATSEQLERLIDRSIDMNDLPHGYVYSAPMRSSTVVETCQRMLDWVEALGTTEIRDGLARRFRHRGLPPPPPLAVLDAFLERHADFEKDGDQVRALTTRPPDETTVVAWIIQQIRDSGLDVIHRTVLHDAARQAGQNSTSVQMYSSYSELLAQAGEGCITLVGTRLEPWAIDQARRLAAAIRIATRVERTTEIGAGIALTIQVGNSLLDTGVLPITKSLGRRLAHREFDLFGDDTQRGHLKLSGQTALIGFVGALTQLHVMPGDHVELVLNFETLVARVTVPDS